MAGVALASSAETALTALERTAVSAAPPAAAETSARIEEMAGSTNDPTAVGRAAALETRDERDAAGSAVARGTPDVKPATADDKAAAPPVEIAETSEAAPPSPASAKDVKSDRAEDAARVLSAATADRREDAAAGALAITSVCAAAEAKDDNADTAEEAATALPAATAEITEVAAGTRALLDGLTRTSETNRKSAVGMTVSETTKDAKRLRALVVTPPTPMETLPRLFKLAPEVGMTAAVAETPATDTPRQTRLVQDVEVMLLTDRTEETTDETEGARLVCAASDERSEAASLGIAVIVVGTGQVPAATTAEV
jgi:hypothetical protein